MTITYSSVHEDALLSECSYHTVFAFLKDHGVVEENFIEWLCEREFTFGYAHEHLEMLLNDFIDELQLTPKEAPVSTPRPTYSARITTECFYPSLTVMQYDEFFVENSWMLPTGFTVFSGEAKYNWLNDNGYWVSGEFDDAINDPRVEAEGGEQDEVVIHIDEAYA